MDYLKSLTLLMVTLILISCQQGKKAASVHPATVYYGGDIITIHTDAPVALPNLMRMAGISVERKSRSGQVIGAEEKLTPYEALQAIISWSAFQHFEEDTKGTLEKVKLADMVILDRNPLKVPEEDIKNIIVLETIKEGVSV